MQAQARFENDGPQLYDGCDEDGNQIPRTHFRVVGKIKDTSGELDAALSHDFLVSQGAPFLLRCVNVCRSMNY